MGVLKTCGIGQLPLVYRLCRRGMWLDARQAMLEGGTAFWSALASALPASALRETVYVLENEDSRKEACLQVRRRGGRAEADLLYIAPRLEGTRMMEEVWKELLSGACQQLAEQGVERFYARLPESGLETVVFREVGFSLYTREDLFRLDEWPGDQVEDGGIPLEVRGPVHDWGVERLYHELVPWLVQQAEGTFWPDDLGDGLLWQESVGEYVLMDRDEVAGLLRVRPSAREHWLGVMLHPRAYEWAGMAIASGLNQLRLLPRRPLYCAVREYQGGLRGPLEDYGFRRIGSRALMVRQALARSRVKEPAMVSRAMEKKPQTAFPSVGQVRY